MFDEDEEEIYTRINANAEYEAAQQAEWEVAQQAEYEAATHFENK